MNENQPLGVWLGYKIGFCKNKEISTGQLGSEHDNTMNERSRQLSTGQKRKTNTLAVSNYFYTEKYRAQIFVRL